MYKKLTTKFCSHALFYVQLKRVLMRLMVICLIVGIHFGVYAHAQSVTLNHRNAQLAIVLKEIKQQTGYSFLYDADAVGRVSGITLDIRNANIRETLDLCFKELPLQYVIQGKNVIISKKDSKAQANAVAVEQQQRMVTGTVHNENGESLAGVSIQVKDKTTGAVTGEGGRFTIEVPDANSVLVFSYIGFATQEVSVSGKTEINVVLKIQDSGLEEVVVIGYGELRKKDMTGAVSSIKKEQLENNLIQSLDDALSGKVAGLLVQSGSGQPGAASNILIRGANSLTGSTQPLIVVDGFPLFEVSTKGGGGMTDISGGELSALSFINPDDIASIEVLKDASATAIYGNRGANGVVLVTTKKGGGSQIQYNTYISLQELPRQYDVMDFQEFIKYQAINGLGRNLYVNPETGQSYDFDPNIRSVNWQDEVYRTGYIHNHSLSMQGSKDKTNFMLSSSYMQNKSIIKNTDWKKFTAKVSVDHTFSEKLKVGGDLSFSQIKDDGVPTGGSDGTALGVVIGAILARPFLLDETTQAYFRRAGVDQSTIDNDLAVYRDNPLNLVNAVDLFKVTNRSLINGYVQYNILENLVLRITGGYDVYGLQDQQFYPKSTPTGYFYNGLGILANINSNSWVNENTLTWTPEIEGGHQFNILAGMTEQGWESDFLRTEFSSFENESLGYDNAGMANNFLTYSSPAKTRYMSFLGRINYSYKSKYLATFTARHDGTSVFQNNKWSTFYSGALAYNLKEEDFLKDVNAISNFKLRISLGEVGNSSVPTSGAYAQLYNTSYTFNNERSVGQSAVSLANENLRWERTHEWNWGLELGFLNNRVTLDANYYIKDTKDLLLEAPVLNISGFDKSWQNVGRIRNSGIELNINALLIKSRDFSWDMNINFSNNRSKILELGQNGAPIFLGINFITGASGQQAVILEEGGVIGQLYGYEAAGVYGANDFYTDGTPKPGIPTAGVGEEPGWMKYKDINGDGSITLEDRTNIGKTLPDFFGGFSTSLGWRKINLHLGFQYAVGNSVFNANYMQAARFGHIEYNQMAFYFDRWTNDNPESTQYANMALGTFSSAFVEDASFLRFKTVRLTYDFQHGLLPKTKVFKNLKVYAAAENLFVLTKYSGYDPEVAGNQNAGNMSKVLISGFDYGVFPRPRTFTAGLNVLF